MIQHVITSHLLSTVGFVMGALLVVHLLTQRHPAGTTFAWLLAIVLIPYVGVPLYIVFGGRKLRRQAARKEKLYGIPAGTALPDFGMTRMLCVSGAPEPRVGNRVRLLETGEDAFASLIALIESAHESIEVSTLIFAGDEVGAAVSEALVRRAQAGVRVRVLIDQLFQFRSNTRQLAAMRHAGCRIAWFMPVLHVPFRGHANLRLHRKIVVADGKAAILGGMNMAREYMGPTPLPGRWRDLSALVTGPAVDDVSAVFRADWQFAAGEKLDAARASAPVGDSTIQVVASGPDAPSDLIYDAFLTGIFEARRRLWVATPYFVPDDALTRAFVLAARRGVDVRVVVPARSNHFTADLAGGSYLRQVADAGGQVCCYRPGMMHGKLVIVDDTLGALGSANLDMRSLFLNYEITLFFSTRADIDGLASWFEALLPVCGPLAPAGRARTLIEATARLIAPLE